MKGEQEELGVGIFGCGHLGTAIALRLVQSGYPIQKILVSCLDTDKAKKRLKNTQLKNNVVGNKYLLERSDVVFYGVRPSDVKAILKYRLKKGAVLMTLLAGTPLQKVKTSNDEEIDKVRVMTSAPDTIKNGQGLCARFGENTDKADEVLQYLKLNMVSLESENDFNAFTAYGPCLPIALACCEKFGKEVVAGEIEAAADSQGLMNWKSVIQWAYSAKPSLSNSAFDSYLESVCTPGGVTEAIVNTIKSGNALIDSLNKGVERSVQLIRE